MSINTETEISEIRELVEANNKILKRLQTRARLGTIFQVVKWVVIILAALGIYTFLQPFLQSIFEAYSSLQDSAAAISDIRSNLQGGLDINEIINSFQ